MQNTAPPPTPGCGAPLRVAVSVGKQRRQFDVTADTTIEELAQMVQSSMLPAVPNPPSPLCSTALRLIYKGRQLRLPHTTLGSVGVRDRDNILVIPSKTAPAQAGPESSAAPSYSAPAGTHPALRAVYCDVEGLKANADQLRADVEAALSSSERAALSQAVKALAGLIDRHEKTLCRLDSILSEGDEKLRAERKALVKAVSAAQDGLEELSVRVRGALK